MHNAQSRREAANAPRGLTPLNPSRTADRIRQGVVLLASVAAMATAAAGQSDRPAVVRPAHQAQQPAAGQVKQAEPVIALPEDPVDAESAHPSRNFDWILGVLAILAIFAFLRHRHQRNVTGSGIPAGYQPGQDATSVQGGASAPYTGGQQGQACFFCSRPSSVVPLQPVTIAIGNNSQREVLACPEDAARAQMGTAQVRAVEDNGQMMPWWSVPTYNPQQDYNRPGLASTLLPIGAGIVGGMALEELLERNRPPHRQWMTGTGYQGSGGASNWDSANEASIDSSRPDDLPIDADERDDRDTGNSGGNNRPDSGGADNRPDFGPDSS